MTHDAVSVHPGRVERAGKRVAGERLLKIILSTIRRNFYRARRRVTRARHRRRCHRRRRRMEVLRGILCVAASVAVYCTTRQCNNTLAHARMRASTCTGVHAARARTRGTISAPRSPVRRLSSRPQHAHDTPSPSTHRFA